MLALKQESENFADSIEDNSKLKSIYELKELNKHLLTENEILKHKLHQSALLQEK